MGHPKNKTSLEHEEICRKSSSVVIFLRQAILTEAIAEIDWEVP
ncbi:hypothetical protein DFP98_109205 [Cohnella phaseoli]|uniref:Uncharacterized protein n=1 Tax=Cohnella phaseoli TaxID=456490 RepID=A0A3D9JU46_9BACL|nr:hypothetical protein DFP98_109205 [Cohnella phaseoli]